MSEKDKAKCPVCMEKFNLESDLEVGDIIDCPGCSAGLRIVSVEPLRLEEVTDFIEDYSDDGADQEDYS